MAIQVCGSSCDTEKAGADQNSCTSATTAKTDKATILDSELLSPWVSAYHIPKMDCGAEEQMVRIALADHNDIAALSFDSPARLLKVYHGNQSATEITHKLEALGLGAVLQQTEANTQTELSVSNSAAQQSAVCLA